ncbi:PKD domain-containing protein [Halanaerobacter jeridensis]|uniref:PKD repeat protein n=1 Tax=Halanaerobacter jeridensis TaxID=706427 RepID=A0A938XUF2_9FIRM|nr:carboxypeptidase-like regulatory domain-containing protein [Halanaerobacter jeridensis]MBM7555767.1 PKD repeat protein [Halanaerobacter jeridensis]
MFRKRVFSFWSSALVILLLLFLGGCSGGSGSSNSLYNLSGTVEDENGIGIEGVYISYSGSDATGSTETLSDGSWKLSALKDSVTITPRKEGYTFDPINRYISSAADDVDFRAEEIVIEKTELKTETLEVSNQSQTVEYANEIKVTVPGGMLSTEAELIISSLDSYPTLPENNGVIALFDVEIAEMDEFSKTIEIEFAYNPSDIPEGESADNVLKAIHWNKNKYVWEAKPITVDEERAKATLYTDTLSPVGVFMDSDLTVKNSQHFRLIYDKKMFVDPTEWNSQVEMADKLLHHLEEYYNVYTDDNSFNIPPPHWFQDGRILVRLDEDYVESEWSWKTGAIFMTSYNSRDELKEETAHELFHAVQASYYTTTVEMLFVGRRWWMEATADYAANIIAGAGSLEPIKSDYFIKPISMQNGEHEYQTAHLVDYIVKKGGIDFIEMWEAITNNPKIQVTESLDDYLYLATKEALPHYYHNFVRHMFFSDSAALKDSPADLGVSSNLLAEANSVEKTFNILEDGTASLWVVDVGMDDKKESRYLEFALDHDLSLSVYADVYISDGGRLGSATPIPDASLKYSDDKVLLEVPKNKLVYILATNTGENISTFNLTIRDRDPKLSIAPESLTGEYGEDYTFNFKAENLGEEIENLKFSWDFGDGIVDESSNLSQGETEVAVQNGTAEINVSHKYLAEGDFSIDLKVFDQSGKELEQAEAVVKIDLEQEVVITGARQFVWELRDGATETEHDFEAVVQPRDTGEYEFEWNFGDGITFSETGESSNVSHLYTDLKDGDFFTVTVTLYSLAGEKLAEDSISIEVIEEQAEIVEFIDPNLETAVREELNIPSREMTAADLEELTNLWAVKEEIYNLTGLEFAVNLKSLI